ncbi:MAG TPA: hypothetical protein VGO43_12640 [Pyrinomonadaceae bacterium]|jgi:hypothetical protein|nr:hypothetical protein [Pyrinomonadaceae bacterium]
MSAEDEKKAAEKAAETKDPAKAAASLPADPAKGPAQAPPAPPETKPQDKPKNPPAPPPAAKEVTQVRVISEGTLGHKLLQKGDVTSDPDYVAILKQKGQKKVEAVK